MNKPARAATSEANRILIFDAVITSASVNARFVINILIVKPIPPSNEMPRMCIRVRSGDSDAMLSLVANITTRNMPINFPTKRPSMIPSELLEVKLANKLSGNTIAVLARANSGKMKKATG